MSAIDNINGIYVKDTELRNGISELRGDILSQTIKPLNVTKNGTYTSDPTAGAYGYSPVTVNVSSSIDYSTTEQDTGRKWIDGKPIYQKTFSVDYTFNQSTYNQWVTISEVSINNIENIIDYSMMGTDFADNILSPSVLKHPVLMRYLLTNAYMQVFFTQRYDFILKAVTVWYTKTTDTVN